MAGRFYRSPIDPGYGQFGAAIAAGMGQGIQNFQRGQAQQEEQRRYAAQMARQAEQDRLAAADREIRLAMLGRQKQGREMVPVEPQQGIMQPLPEIAIPAPGTIPEGRQPGMDIGAALGGLQGAPAAPGGIASATGEFFGVPQQAAPQAGLTIPGVLQGDMAFQSQAAPEGFTSYSEGGEDFYFDPTQSYDYKQAVAHEERQEAKAKAKRDEIQMMLSEITADGIVTPDERAWLVANGLKESDLEDPAQARETAFNDWLRKEKVIQQHQISMQDRRISADRQTVTGNRADDNRRLEVRGRAILMMEQGKTPQEILAALGHYAEGLGGEGALSMQIRQALDDYEQGISSAALRTVGEMGIYPEDPGWREALRETQDFLSKNRVRLGAPAASPIEAAVDPAAPVGSRENPTQGPRVNARPPAERAGGNTISSATGAAAPALTVEQAMSEADSLVRRLPTRDPDRQRVGSAASALKAAQARGDSEAVTGRLQQQLVDSVQRASARNPRQSALPTSFGLATGSGPRTSSPAQGQTVFHGDPRAQEISAMLTNGLISEDEAVRRLTELTPGR
jgi:hypothetical protein